MTFDAYYSREHITRYSGELLHSLSPPPPPLSLYLSLSPCWLCFSESKVSKSEHVVLGAIAPAPVTREANGTTSWLRGGGGGGYTTTAMLSTDKKNN